MQHIKSLAAGVLVCLIICGTALSASAELGFGIKGGMLIPDQDPFKDEFDSNFLLGGVLEMDSNLGLTLEANVEYFQQDSNKVSGGDVTIIPLILSAKYNFLPRYRTTPFIGVGAGTFFFDKDLEGGGSKSQTRFGVRVSAGLRFLEDRRVNLVLEGAKNFVDFDDENASSFQVTFSLIFDLSPTVIGAQ